MPSDTFVGSVSNPTEAYGDITKVIVCEQADITNYKALTENGTIWFNYTPVYIIAYITNTGQLDGSFTATLYIDNIQKEQQTVSIAGGQSGEADFKNANVGYANPDGETHEYKVTVTP